MEFSRLVSQSESLRRSNSTFLPTLIFGGPVPAASQRERVLTETPSIEATRQALTNRRPPNSISSSAIEAALQDGLLSDAPFRNTFYSSQNAWFGNWTGSPLIHGQT
jgi:hypothetical protein